ncbi:MAG: NAD(P)/FAD-dependent oxidoreductase [Roseiflexaceae bacterium]
MHDLVIIGGGAAGLSAALYALGKGLDAVTIYEDVGGKAGTQQQLAGQAGEEYLAGVEAVQLFERRVTSHAGAVLRDRVIELRKYNGIFQIETQHHGALEARAVLIATGATPLKLDVPGAKALLDHGIGYSITTHSQLLAGKRVAVVGATMRALRGVIELARVAKQVYLITPDAIGMTHPLARSLRQFANVTLLIGYRVVEIAGAMGVEQVAVEHEGERSWLQVDAAFADLGLLPNSGVARQLARVNVDGFIMVDDRNATTQPGLFAAGDVTTAFAEQVLIAIGDGARAAVSAYDYLLS